MNIKNKLSSLMYAPLALALLAACSSDDVVENNQPTTQGQTLTIMLLTSSLKKYVFYNLLINNILHLCVT